MKFGPVYIDHIGIATHRLDDHTPFWSLLGLHRGNEDETVADQGVTTRFFSTSHNEATAPVAKIELLEPTGEDTPVGRFLSKRGPVFSKCVFPWATSTACFSTCSSTAYGSSMNSRGKAQAGK